MDTTPAIITRIAVTDSQIFVFPAEPRSSFDWIYRAAMSVRWDVRENRFFVLPEAQLTLDQQFRQICMAARSELGIDLRIDSRTMFDNVPEHFLATIGAPATRP